MAPDSDHVNRYGIFMVAPIEAYAAILFIDTITPTPAPQKQ
jgi:hypothetical protein